MENDFSRNIISLVSVACGKSKATMYLANGKIVNVLTGEILTGMGIALADDRIAYVGPESGMIGDRTEIIDCHHAYIIPGYVDAHCHMDYLHNPPSFARHVLVHGTTTLLSELTELGALSAQGLEYMLNVTEGLPVRCFFSLPSTIPPFPDIEGMDLFDISVMKRYADHPRVLALGEITSWPRIISLDHHILEKIEFASARGWRIEGHLTGCKTHEINALAAAGITSCHESITAAEAREKLRLGLYVMLRHGSVRADMAELSRLITDHPQICTSRLILNLDWSSPEDMMRFGHMNYLVKSAVECGIDPIRAIQMVTINPATYLGLDTQIGCIAPGRKADILILKELEQGVPDRVIAEGRLVAEDGRLLDTVPFPDRSVDKLRLPNWPSGRYDARDFHVQACNTTAKTVNFPVIRIVSKAITKRMDIALPVKDSQVGTELPAGLLKLSVIGPDATVTSAFVHGFGDRIGGLATSLGVYNNKILILGNNDPDMATATNRMLDLDGGIVLVQGNRIVSEVPLPIAGVQPREDISTLATRMKNMRKELEGLGCSLEDPFFTIHFLTMSGLPYLRILPGGLLDVVNRRFISQP